jgi:hypothetical protein
MANQIEVPKLTQEIALGAPAGNISVTKLVMYVLLEPGDSGTDSSNRQGHTHAQLIRR